MAPLHELPPILRPKRTALGIKQDAEGFFRHKAIKEECYLDELAKRRIQETKDAHELERTASELAARLPGKTLELTPEEIIFQASSPYPTYVPGSGIENMGNPRHSNDPEPVWYDTLTYESF